MVLHFQHKGLFVITDILEKICYLGKLPKSVLSLLWCPFPFMPSSPSQPLATIDLSLLPIYLILSELYVNEMTQYDGVFLRMASFTSLNASEIHLLCYLYW